MTADPQEIKAIAKGLTDAQRKWLPEFDVVPRQWYPIGCAKTTVQGLVKKGALQAHNPGGGIGFVKWSLTPLGLAVRQHLLDKEAGDGR